MAKSYSEITPKIQQLADKCKSNNHIQAEMYTQNNVKRGLRDQDGNGVVTGLTEISKIVSKAMMPDGSEHPCKERSGSI